MTITAALHHGSPTDYHNDATLVCSLFSCSVSLENFGFLFLCCCGQLIQKALVNWDVKNAVSPRGKEIANNMAHGQFTQTRKADVSKNTKPGEIGSIFHTEAPVNKVNQFN